MRIFPGWHTIYWATEVSPFLRRKRDGLGGRDGISQNLVIFFWQKIINHRKLNDRVFAH